MTHDEISSFIVALNKLKARHEDYIKDYENQRESSVVTYERSLKAVQMYNNEINKLRSSK